MIFSEKWLREYVNPSLDTHALAEQISMAGLESRRFRALLLAILVV